jgi:hypothetical protein
MYLQESSSIQKTRILSMRMKQFFQNQWSAHTLAAAVTQGMEEAVINKDGA